MTAVGIHDHPEFKLGLAPETKTERELLQIRWRSNIVPSYPDSFDSMTGVGAGLDDNDQLGDCGPTSVDNHRRIKSLRETGTQTNASIAQVLELYSEVTDPPFNPVTHENDNGVQMSNLLNGARKYGLAGEKIVAFGQLSDMSASSIYAAIYVFKAVLFAVNLQKAQQQQSDAPNPVWDFVRNSPDWGGHAIVGGAYNANSGIVDVFSWAMRIGTTVNFRAQRLMQVWVPIYQSTIDDTHDTVDYATMSNEFKSLTGDTLPPPTPSPIRPPEPEPVPDGAAPFPGATDIVARHIASAANKAHVEVPDWMNRHFTNYFK